MLPVIVRHKFCRIFESIKSENESLAKEVGYLKLVLGEKDSKIQTIESSLNEKSSRISAFESREKQLRSTNAVTKILEPSNNFRA